MPETARAASTGDALRPGAWALELNKDATSGDAGIGILRHHSERTAYRLNVGFSYSDDGERGTDRIVPGQSGPYYNRFYSRTYDLVLNWVHYFSLSDGFAAQFGLGPAAYWNSSTNSQGTTTISSYTYTGGSQTTNTNGTANSVRSEYGRIILTAYL